MNLTPREKDKLLIAVAAQVARARLTRGVKLNYPESLTRDQVMEGIPEMIHEMQVEATFPDSTKLVSVHDPIR